MPADNSLYESLEDWWDPTGAVAGLHAMNPARSRYVLDVLRIRLGPPSRELALLDVGCGGGLLVEPLLRAGWRVIGVDAALGALRRASTHGREQGLATLYVAALAEKLPFADRSFAA
ncbi:MAG: methyltransferase domain-containing protein, partial [Vicinamibacteria bacterium]